MIVSSTSGRLALGRSSFEIEFRSAATGRLVDVGDVSATGAMSMPGMVMPAGIAVTTGEAPDATPPPATS